VHKRQGINRRRGGAPSTEDPEGSPTRKLIAGDILVFPHGSAHAGRDGSDAAPAPARQRSTLTTVFLENDGTGDRLDMMCGRFILSTAHERLIRSYLPRRLVLRAPENSAAATGRLPCPACCHRHIPCSTRCRHCSFAGARSGQGA
jgi:AraC family transcriptional activator of mtrCDE